nr:hypothetical protein P5626_12670 [Bacillus subtilis]
MKKKKARKHEGFLWIFFSKLVGSSFFCCLDVYTNYLYKGKKDCRIVSAVFAH